MNRLISLLAISGGMLLLASCSQDEIIPDAKTKAGIPIEFRAGISSRVNPDFDYSSRMGSIYVTGYRGDHKIKEDGEVPVPHFADELFTQTGDNNSFTSSNHYNWPESGTLEFFAYAPSLQDIRNAAYTQLDPTLPSYKQSKENYDASIAFFNQCRKDNQDSYDPVAGSNTFDGVRLYSGYKLARFYVATDISKQVDFITAHAEAVAPEKDSENIAVELNFKHQLTNVELHAYSANKLYNIEIAGVRIGRPYTGNAIFNFCDTEGHLSYAEGGQWGISKKPQRLPVEYIYSKGDSIVRLGSFPVTVHNTKEKAANLMGKGGNAMVIPTKNGPWAGKARPDISINKATLENNNNSWWSADNKEEGDMYFSVLLRITLKSDGTQIYPYRNNNDMHSIFLAKEKFSNCVIGQVDRDATAGTNEEIMEFGWATVPVGVDWKRGTKYVYILDFTDGVGVRDPDDPEPGTPIIGGGVTFTVGVSNWNTQDGGEINFE